jgi:uncharacterized protein
MSQQNTKLMLAVFDAIERRDPATMLEFFRADVEFHWPPMLPYGGTARGLLPSGPTWQKTWDALQPSETERRMDPHVLAASEDEAVVLWRQRGVSPSGDRLDQPVLGLYRIEAGKIARAQMFYFDTAAVVSFLAKARSEARAFADGPASEHV